MADLGKLIAKLRTLAKHSPPGQPVCFSQRRALALLDCAEALQEIIGEELVGDKSKHTAREHYRPIIYWQVRDKGREALSRLASAAKEE